MKWAVTFDSMEVMDSTTGAASAVVRLNGHPFGEILKNVEDVGGTSFEWRATEYEVNLDDSEDTRYFQAEDHGGARGALAAAKAYARAALQGSTPGADMRPLR